MTYKRHTPIYLLALMLIFSVSLSASTEQVKQTATPRATKIARTMTPTRTPTRTVTPTLSATLRTPSATATNTATDTPTVTSSAHAEPTQAGNIAPYPSAPLCEDTGENHDNSRFHTIWNSTRGCHYDHEHGQSPFISEVSEIFPGFDLRVLLGGVGVGHTNPSSPMENTHKHGGFKWQVDLSAPKGCLTGFEGGTVAVKAYAIQFHAFGRQDIEHEARNHSSVAMLALCKDGNPNDVGYMYVTQLQEYGQRLMQYQGWVMPYPDNFLPQYISPRGPYFTSECFGGDFSYVDATGVTRMVDCRGTYSDPNNNNTIWSSKPTCSGQPCPRPLTPLLFKMLFRGRDNYQRVDVTDRVHPFTWMFVCGGQVYNPAGCRFNSSTMTIHEIAGTIPASWDNLAGFDTDPRVGRITAQGFVTRYGDLNPSCAVAGGLDCQVLVLVNAFVGTYSSDLCADKCSNPNPLNTPERDIYFLNGAVVDETTPGAIPSGWIGSEN